MMGRMMTRMALAVAFSACLVGSAWATSSSSCCYETFYIFLPGVECNGCLSCPSDPDYKCDGDCVSDCVCVNCCTGKFCGTVYGCVKNESCCPHTYYCKDFFCDCDVHICTSCYFVGKCGNCCYTFTAVDCDY